jgi:aryl-alcohol dehydrogenase-like predicted oxidoreductase
MKINRRDFLAALTAAAGAAAFGSPVSARRTGPFAVADPFRLVPLGRTGIQVSLIGAGTGMAGAMRESNMTRLGMERYTAVLRHAFDRGIRFYDCADLYGTHPFVAEAFKSVPREQITLCSKIWFSPGGLPEPERPDADIVVDRFRKELKTDYIDLVLIHCMTDADWTEQQKRQMDILSDLKAKGIIRAHGVSIHSLEALKACVDCEWVDSVHARINAFGAAMDDRNPDRVAPVLEAIHKAGKGVVGMKLIGGGHFRDKPGRIDSSIKYALGLGTVDTLIVGFESEREIDDFAERVQKGMEEGAAN